MRGVRKIIYNTRVSIENLNIYIVKIRAFKNRIKGLFVNIWVDKSTMYKYKILTGLHTKYII